MRVKHLAVFAVSTALWLVPAQAQESSDTAANSALKDEVAHLRAEVEAMREEMRSMRDAAAQAAAAPIAVPAAAPTAIAQSTPAAAPQPDPNAVQISWKGMPEFRSPNGWSFKPRGRMQIDGGYLAAPESRFSGQADGRGFTTRVRRAYIGMQGSVPGGFTYRAEAEFAGNSVSWTDLYMSYDTGPFTFTVGQHHPFTSMEQLQSDLFLTFNERAGFIGAFNLERRVGLSAGWKGKAVMANIGVFTDDLGSVTNDGDKSVSVDSRVVWMPKLGKTQFHLGGSAHYRDLGKFQATLGTRYRQRPYIGTTDIRYIDTGILTVDREMHYGAEFALNRKRFHLVGEAAWLKVDRPGNVDPIFFGGYVEAGFFLTNDSRSYKGGMYDRTSPSSPLGDGGWGALEFDVRYDHLDLTDKNVGGGTQDGFGAAFTWTPNSYVRFMLNYMHLIYDIPSAQPKFNADVVGLRAQIDF